MVLLALLLFVAGLSLNPITESDLFFRLKIGQEIWAQGAIPARNLLSFTYPDHPDLDLAWLSEVLMAGAFGLGGFPAVVLMKTAVLVATFAGAFWICRRRGAGPIASALALAAAAWVMRERLVERPHIFSFLGLVALLAVVERLESDRRVVLSPVSPTAMRLGAAVFGLVVLWANLHAGAFVAAIVLALYTIGAAVDGWRGRRVAFLAALTALAVVALLATPAGVGIFRYLWLHIQLPRLHPVDEFRAPTWISDAPLVIFAAAVITTVILLRRRLPVRALLPIFGAGLLTWQAVRFGADLSVLAAPVLAVGLSSLGARLHSAAGARLVRAAAPATALLLAAAAIAPRAAAVSRGQPFLRVDVDMSGIPLDAIRFVEQHGLRQRMYNDFEIGSYLVFEGYPRFRVFVDPRLPAYPQDFHRLLGRADLTREDWDQAMARHQIDSALLAYAGVNRRVAWWDPQTWALVYRQHDARVFVRRSPERRAFIAAREIPATFRFGVETGAVTVPLGKPPATSPVPGCVWQQRLGDLLFELAADHAAQAEIAYRRALAAAPGCLPAAEEVRLAAWLGAVDLRAGRWQDALVLLDRALAQPPGSRDLATLTNRAITLEALGDRAAASSAWARVAADAAGTPLGEKARDHQRRAAAAAAAPPVSSPSETRPTRR